MADKITLRRGSWQGGDRGVGEPKQANISESERDARDEHQSAGGGICSATGVGRKERG